MAVAVRVVDEYAIVFIFEIYQNEKDIFFVDDVHCGTETCNVLVLC